MSWNSLQIRNLKTPNLELTLGDPYERFFGSIEITNMAKFYAYLLLTDMISWSGCIHS
jgi:hypothetical protein